MVALVKILPGIAAFVWTLMGLLIATGDWAWFLTSIPIAFAVFLAAVTYRVRGDEWHVSEKSARPTSAPSSG